MAANLWDNSDLDNDANNANNWSLGTVPAGTDVATFDNTSDANCLFSGSISCAEIDVTADYDGDIDMATFNLTTTGDMTFDGTGIFDCGTGTLTCSGNFDNQDQGTWTRGESTVVMDGTTKTIISSNSKDLHNLTVSGTVENSASTSFSLDVNNDLVVSGTLTLSEALMVLSGSINLTGGTIDGTDELVMEGGVFTAGTIGSGVSVIMRRNVTLNAGTYGGSSWVCEAASGNRTLTLGSGTFVFSGDITFDADVSGGTYAVDLGANNPDVEFQSSLTLDETGGGGAALTWIKSSGTVTFGGATTYQDNTAAGPQNLGDVDIDGTSLSLASNMDCDNFDGISGTLTSNSNTIDCAGNLNWTSGFIVSDVGGSTFLVGGNFTADGQTVNGLSTWALTVTGTAVASGSGSVANSDASGGTEIDASAGPWTDGGSNTNWDFGAVADDNFAFRHLFLLTP